MNEQKYQLSTEPVTVYDENGTPMFESNKDARTWGMISHLSGGLVILGIPLLHILGPLAVWQESSPLLINETSLKSG
jgi:uncharacterized Tic20 family protein